MEKFAMMKSATAKLALVALFVPFAGCSIINPHEPLERLEIAGSVEPAERDLPGAITMRESIEHAQRAEDHLMRKIGDQSLFRNSIAITELLLAGGLGAAALTGVSQDVLIAGSVAGVTGLAIADWFDSTPRQRTYLLGIKAIICAIEAVTPLQSVTKSDAKLNTLNIEIENAEASIGNVKQTAAHLRFLLGGESPLTLLAREEVSTTDAAITVATEIHTNGTGLRHEAVNAGTNLETTVDKIRSSVTGDVISTETQLRELRGIIQGLVPSAPGFLKLPEVSAFPQLPGAATQGTETDSSGQVTIRHLTEINELRNALLDLSKNVAAMRRASRVIAAELVAVDGAKSIEELKKCGVDIGSAIEPFAIDHSGSINFVSGTAGSADFTASGGNGKYSGEFRKGTAGLRFEQTYRLSPNFLIIATAETAVGSYSFIVSDTSDNKDARKVVTIEVAPKQEGSTSPASGQGVASATAVTVTDIDVESLQGVLAAHGFDPGTIDGIRGGADSKTNKAMQSFLDTIAFDAKKATDIETKAFDQFVAAVVGGLDASRLGDPKGVRDIMIEKLLEATDHPLDDVNGIIDSKTETAIAAFNNGQPMAVATDDELEAVLKALRDAGVKLKVEKELEALTD